MDETDDKKPDPSMWSERNIRIRQAVAAMTPEECDHDDFEVVMANLRKRLGEDR